MVKKDPLGNERTYEITAANGNVITFVSGDEFVYVGNQDEQIASEFKGGYSSEYDAQRVAKDLSIYIDEIVEVRGNTDPSTKYHNYFAEVESRMRAILR